MRLTLRTLIAYLDDELQADQAKEIGQKLAESGYATALVERIKEVMRRRRLSAPELFGKGAGLDPNLVAEYLDSELTPAEVVDVEKICLDSDMHLAEVAACHQILTLVLGDPVEVRPETRSRMYGLGPVAMSDSLRANDFASVSPGRDGRPIPAIASALAPSQDGSGDRGLPEYLQPRSSWRQTAVVVLVLLVGIGWFSLLMNDHTVTSGLRPGSAPQKDSTLPQRAMAAAADGSPDVGAKNPAGSQLVAVADQQAAASDSSAANNPRAVKTAPTAEAPGDQAEPNVKPAPEQPVAANGRTPKAAAVVAPPQPAEAVNSPEPEPAPVKRMPPINVARVSKEGIVLRFEPDAGDFLVMPKIVQLKAGDYLACPEPFRSDFIVGDDLCSVALIGGTAVRFLGPDQQASVGFDIQQGALLFDLRALPVQASDGAAANPEVVTLPITLVFYGRPVLLELASDNTVCGVEVRRLEPTHFETQPESPGYAAALYVSQGAVRFTSFDGKATVVQGPGFLPITEGVTATERKSEIGRPSQLMLPDWLEPDPKRAASKAKRPYNSVFEKEFDEQQPLQLSLPAVVSNPRPAISELAVKCLALTDSYEPLIKAMIHGEHREARLAAISGLRQWLPLDPKNRQLLKAELAKHFLPSDADAVYRLLWGFDLSDAANPVTSRALVGWLDSEQLAIRELAFLHIQRLTGLKHEYSPINPPGQRRAAVDRWYNHLEKKGGALVME